MILDDLFDTPTDQQTATGPDTSQAEGIFDKLLKASRSTQDQLTALQNKPAPKLDIPSQDAALDPLATDYLRGAFQSMMPPSSNVPDFGSQFRQSISPGREFLANLFNGISSSFLGTKFQSVRDQAFDQFSREQQLQQNQAQIQNALKTHLLNTAQSLYENKAKDELQRDIQAYKSAKDEKDQQITLLKLQQTAQKYNLDVASLLQKTAHDNAMENKSSNPFVELARKEVAGTFAKNGWKTDDPQHGYDSLVTARAMQLMQQNEAAKAEAKPEKPKEATPQLVYIPQPDGSFRVQQVAGGSVVPPGGVSQAGMTNENIPTSTTRTMIEKAPSVVDFADKIDKQIDPVLKELGQAKGAWHNFMLTGAGVKDPELKKLRTNVLLLQTRLMNMHVGARGGDKQLEHFREIIDTGKDDPANMRAALGEIKDYAESVMKEGGVTSVRTGASAPKVRKFNPATGKLE